MPKSHNGEEVKCEFLIDIIYIIIKLGDSKLSFYGKAFLP